MFVRPLQLCLALTLGWVSVLAEAQPPELGSFNSAHYAVHTDLTRHDAQPIAQHMDAVYARYAHLFIPLRGQRAEQRHGLYLVSTREVYAELLDAWGVQDPNPNGGWVSYEERPVLVYWVQGRPLHETLGLMQHGGFHQFAAERFAQPLPVWVREGLAIYFEQAIRMNTRVQTGLVSPVYRDAAVVAVVPDAALSLEDLMQADDTQWAQSRQAGSSSVASLGPQAWSVVHFLLEGSDGAYVARFERYLARLANGEGHGDAFAEAFEGVDLDALETQWSEETTQLTPDAHAVAVMRLAFLAEGMRWLVENGVAVPETIDDLESLLRLRRFSLRWAYGRDREVVIDAADSDPFTYPGPRGLPESFSLAPIDRRHPPQVHAGELRPEPYVEWSEDHTGGLIYRVRYR